MLWIEKQDLYRYTLDVCFFFLHECIKIKKIICCIILLTKLLAVVSSFKQQVTVTSSLTQKSNFVPH